MACLTNSNGDRLNLSKKFSIGVSFGKINSDEYCEFLKKYSAYIHDIFFSPTEGYHYLTRRLIYDLSNTTNDERIHALNKVLSYAKELGIKINLSLNSHALQVDDAISTYLKYSKLFLLDYVTTSYKIAKAIRNIDSNIEIICSYNEGIKDYDKLHNVVSSNFFNCVVLGNNFIRDKKAFEIINDGGLKSILLVNNGCTWSCNIFCNGKNADNCKNIFIKELTKTNINELYANQSIFPEELHEYENGNFGICIYKLSSRPITFNELNDLLSAYTSEDSRSFILKDISNYHLFARLAHFCKYYPFLEYDKIIEYKKQYWNAIHNLAH